MIKQLIADGHQVRGTLRDMSKAADVKALGAQVVEVPNLADEEALKAAFAGVDGIFHMAAVHPEYGFAQTPEGRAGILAAAVDGTVTTLKAAKAVGVKRIVLTSSLAAVECGNDEGVLTEATWAKPEVYDSAEKLEKTQWSTHYTYVKSKVEQEKAATAFAAENGLDMRVVVPGNLCVGPIASPDNHINGTMTRLKDIVTGTNTLKGAADLGIVHVSDVVAAHIKCMTLDSASGRYLVSSDMVPIEDVFATLKALYPNMPVAEMSNMDIASGVPGKARKIESRATTELGLELHSYKEALKESVDSMIERKIALAAC